MTYKNNCDRILRRDMIRIGALGTAGLSIEGMLQLAEAREVKNAKASSAIFINLAGGPSHIDSFDPKPDSPVEYRGEFSVTQTNVPGMILCEHLPRLAKCAHLFALLRGVSHSLTEHQMGRSI